jgi:hypothetical protein
MKILVTALAAAGLVLSSGAALAQATSSLGVGTGFEDVDTDDNGMVSWAEFSLVFTDITEEQFNTADADGDGFLSAGEFDSLTLQTGSIAPEHGQTDPVPLQSTIDN